MSKNTQAIEEHIDIIANTARKELVERLLDKIVLTKASKIGVTKNPQVLIDWVRGMIRNELL